MKRTGVFILLFCFLVPYSEAQIWKRKRYQVTLGIGSAQLLGDIGGYSNDKNLLGLKDISIRQNRVNLNVNLKYRITHDFSVRLSLTGALLHASDVKGSNELRGFESSVTLFEPALLAEYYFIKSRAEKTYLISKSRMGFFKFLDFYAFTGIGGAAYASQGNDKLIARGIAPGGFTAVIPAGLGTNLVYSPVLNFGLELGARYALSDNIDGYHSQYSSINDVYYFFNFTFTYKLKTGANKWPSLR
jgi:hypothetical protein